MRAHLVQFDIRWEDKPANFARVREMLAGISVASNDLILLPEMFDTGFSLNVERTADDSTLTFLQDLARTRAAYVQGGRTVHDSVKGRATNRAPVIAPTGEVIFEYAKIHPFSFGREAERFDGGDAVLVYQWEGTCVCPAICYDLRFPELFRIGLMRGAEVFTLGANWPDARQSHWRTLLLARAIENEAIVLGVNRTGRDPHLNYVGGSIAVGPKGEVLGELGEEEAVLSVELDIDSVRSWRARFPAWRDIRLLNQEKGQSIVR